MTRELPRRSVPARQFAPRLAERSIAEFLDDHCPQYAASIAYHVLFSIFPLAIVVASAAGIVLRATDTRTDVVDAIVANVPLSASGSRQLRSLLEGATGRNSTAGLVAIVGLVYGASGMMAAIRLSLGHAWDIVDDRPYLKGKLVDVGLLFAAAALALASVGLTLAARLAGGGAVGWLLGVLVPLATSFAVVLFLYRFVPSTEVHLRDTWPAALLAACVFVLTENLFALYVGHFADYNAVYGSLGAVIAFVFFVYLSSLVFLFGAEMASEWPRVRAHFQRGEPEEDGEPLSRQVVGLVKGLWVRQH